MLNIRIDALGRVFGDIGKVCGYAGEMESRQIKVDSYPTFDNCIYGMDF